ncbi:MAG: DNA polymerase III subunit alpha [Marinifilaceae bacterium]|jgi:DNA polymerase-3 subunit alpha|nr:DNA polymerase III subunit alpha [Marinifilaceae bacterium]
MLLNSHSQYSFKYGCLNIKELVEIQIRFGYEYIVLTDINNTAAILYFIKEVLSKSKIPVVGVDFRNGNKKLYVGIAKNQNGLLELNNFLSYHNEKKISFPSVAPVLKDVAFIYNYVNTPSVLEESHFIGVDILHINNFTQRKKEFANKKYLAMHSSTYRHQQDYNIHRLLRAIDKNTLLSKLDRNEQADENDKFISIRQLEKSYKSLSYLLSNTFSLLESCKLEIEFGKSKNKKYYLSNSEEDYILLTKLAYEGAYKRFGEISQDIENRLKKELLAIKEYDFCSYFLINKDIVDFATESGFFYVGRGSGANSLVAYVLFITNVNPIDLDLYFERFINPYRASPPDFDIDFSWKDRDIIVKYIFEKYGYEYVALMGSYVKFTLKSAIRELGKVFGLPETEIKKIQKNIYSSDSLTKLCKKYACLIKDFPSHNSIHASGVIISQSPIRNYTSTQMLPKGFPSTVFDMYIAEELAYHKFDILSQRGLSKIKDCLSTVKLNIGQDVDIHNIEAFFKDSRLCQMLKAGDTIGCFYVESPAMRMLISKLEVNDYRHLVAASSIIRPGVSQSGMMREYILRAKNPERAALAKKEIPELYEILSDTYGVMVYQEDVMKVASLFAGLSLAEADLLRRGMSWKFKDGNQFDKVKSKFFQNCLDKKYDYNIVKRIWNQIESFAGYAFAKGHSASYAVESFQALFLKAYFPIELMLANINNGGGYYSIEVYLIEALKSGATINPPCINTSENLSIVKGVDLYLGFFMINGIENKLIEAILLQRNKNGSFKDLQDFIYRLDISIEQLSLLIRVGAFRFTNKKPKELLWEANIMLNINKSRNLSNQLFGNETHDYDIPKLEYFEFEFELDCYDLLGVYLLSPFKLLRNKYSVIFGVDHLKVNIGNIVTVIAYLVSVKTSRTKTGEIMYFGTWYDKDYNWIDTVHFPPVAKKFPFRGKACYEINAKVVEEFGFLSLEVNSMTRLEFIRYVDL